MLSFFAKRLKDMQEVRRDERGFTLIELLVVIIIIGVLAAIAIPTFLAQRERAWEAAAQSDLRNLAAAMTSYSSTNNGSFAGASATNLQTQGYNRTTAVDVVVAITGSGTGYNAYAQHTAGGRRFCFTVGTAAYQGVQPGQVGVCSTQPAAPPTTAALTIT